MNIARVCPKCGSDQILDDECVKCGVLVSKYIPPRSSAPVSGASPAGSKRYPTPEQTAAAYDAARKKQAQQTQIISVIIILLLVGGAYGAYKIFKSGAAAINGDYKNGNAIFSIRFKEDGWKHYYPEELNPLVVKDFPIQNLDDGFYRGKAKAPEVFFVVKRSLVTPAVIETRFDAEEERRLRLEAESEIKALMAGTGFNLDLQDKQKVDIKGNDGFIFHGSLSKSGVFYKAVIYQIFKESKGLTFLFVGPDESKVEQTATKIMESFGYSVALV